MYEYGNARVRAMKSRLIGRHALESLVARYDVEQMVSALAQTDYATDIALAMTRFSGRSAWRRRPGPTWREPARRSGPSTRERLEHWSAR